MIKLTQNKHGADLQQRLQKNVIWSSRAHITISTKFQRKITEPEISHGRALYIDIIIIIYLQIKKTRVRGVDTGSLGLVGTRVYIFYALLQ